MLVTRGVQALLSSAGLATIVLGIACGGAAVPTQTATRAPAGPTATQPSAPTGTPTRAAAVTATAAPTTAPTATPVLAAKIPRGGTLTLSLYGLTPPLDPDLTLSSAQWEVTDNVYDTLLRLGQDRQVKPNLLESWELVDGKDWVFHLKKGVKFQDGTDFNATAIKAKFDRNLKLGARSRPRGYLTQLAGAQVIDDNTLRVNLSAPSVSFLSYLDSMPGFVYSPAALAAQGGEDMEKPVGVGPFKFVELVLNDHATLERFPDYWAKDEAGQQLPYVDRVRYQIIPDLTVRMANVRTGGNDIALYLDAPPFPQITSDPNLRLLQAPLENPIIELRMWRGHPPYDNRFNIKALAFAIDREAISQGLFGGVYPPAKGYLTPGQWAYDPDFKGYYLDLDQAKRSLVEAGNPNGFTAKIEVGSGDLLRLRVGEAIKSQVAKVGIVLNVDIVEPAALTARTQDGTATTTISLNLGFGSDPNYLMKQPLHSKGAFNVHLGGAGKPYVTPGYDELIDKADDPARSLDERIQLYRQAQRLVFDWGTNRVPIVYGSNALAYRNGVVGGSFNFAPGGLLLLERIWVNRS